MAVKPGLKYSRKSGEGQEVVYAFIWSKTSKTSNYKSSSCERETRKCGFHDRVVPRANPRKLPGGLWPNSTSWSSLELGQVRWLMGAIAT